MKNVPGRKSDVSDCEWLQELHSVGLLRASFRPAAEIAVLRAYVRHHRGEGLRILRDIVAGRRDPQALAEHRDYRCAAYQDQIIAALTGHYQLEHLFVLKQNLESFDAYQSQIAACDVEIEPHLQKLAAESTAPLTSVPPPRTRRQPRLNEPRFEIRSPLHRLTGVDLFRIDGLGPYRGLRLLSEIGTDRNPWPTEKHFTSWLSLAPRNEISGGRLLSSHTVPSANRAATILRLAARSLGRTQTALGAFYRRLAYRGRETESHHRHRAQTRHPGLPRPQTRAGLPRSRSRDRKGADFYHGPLGFLDLQTRCS